MGTTMLVDGELDISHLMGGLIDKKEAFNMDTVRYKIYKGLHDGIVNENTEMVGSCIKTGISLDRHFDESISETYAGITPLALACALNRVTTVKMLLDNNADINLPYAQNNTTALMTSAYHGHLDIIKLLLQYGADIQAEDILKSNAMGYAFGGKRNTDVIRTLLDAGIDVNHKNCHGMDALLLAAGYGDEGLVRMLLEYRANPNTVNSEGHTALHRVIIGKHNRIRKKLNIQGSPEKRNRRLVSSRKVCDWVDSNPNLLGDIKMHMQDYEKADELLAALNKEMKNDSAKEYLLAINKYRSTQRILHNKGKSGIFSSCAGGQSEQTKAAAGSKPQSSPTKDISGALVDEKIWAYAGVMLKLLHTGCKRDAVEKKYKLTALDLAFIYSDIESIALLTSHGAENTLRLLSVSEFYESVKTSSFNKAMELVQTDPNLDLNKVIPENMFLITPDARDVGMTPLTLVCSTPSTKDAPLKTKLVKLMLKKVATVNEAGPSGRYPLTEVAANGDLDMASLLIKEGADVEVESRAYNNATPLLTAVLHMNKQMVQFLIQKGAKVDKAMTDNRNAVYLSFENNDQEMMKILLSASLEKNYSSTDSFVAETARYYRSSNYDINDVLNFVKEMFKTAYGPTTHDISTDAAILDG